MTVDKPPRTNVLALNDVSLPLLLLALGKRVEWLKDPQISVGDHARS